MSLLAAANKYDRPAALPKGRTQMLLKNITSKQNTKLHHPVVKAAINSIKTGKGC
jgi:hypothetical protein